ncbi:MAG: hypothetical protein KAI72_02375, partial [Candidatus Pacebacteria bacterium]|nr:hypothetical protein [Candidatus Paceibacterota bacterium]
MAITNAMAIYQLNDPQAFNTVLVGIHKRLINDVNKSLTLQDVINDYQVSKENAEKIMQALGALDKEFTDIAGIDFVYDSKDPEDSSKWKIRKLNMEVIAKEVFRSYDNRSNDADFYITDKVSFYIGLGQTLMQKKLYESYGIQKDISEMKMVAGMDVRWASTRIKNAYMYGMRVAGVDVTDISSDELRASTPLVYFGGWYFKDLDGGIVVTGSHMRPNGCGLKATARTQIKEGEFLVLNFDQDQQGLHKDLVLQLAQDKALRMSIKAEKTGKLIDELSIKEKIRYDYVTYLLSYFAFGSRETREILNKDESDRKVNAFNVLEQKLNNLSAEDKAKLVQLSKIGFVMDGMEGSGGDVLMLLDKRLGQLIEGLNSEMKNTNINPDFETSRDNMPDPTRGTNLKKFADYLTLKSTWDKGIRVYIGYDNDQDRIGVVISYKEASGKINYKVLNGDEIGGVVIKYLAKLYPGFKIAGVGDIKCGDVGKLSVEDAGGEYHTWITGHSWIKRKMFELERENADIISLMGFEQSGHFFIRDNFLLDDSLLTGVVLLKVIIEEFGADLDKLIEDLGVFPITPEIRPEFDAQTTGWKTKPSREELAEFKNNVIEKKVQEQFSEDKGYR